MAGGYRQRGRREQANTARGKVEVLLNTSRHEEGKALLAQALAMEHGGRLFRAKLLAGRALGFRASSPSVRNSEPNQPFPTLLRDHSPEALEARRILNRIGDYPLLWQSPFTAHHDGRVTSVSWSRNGRFIASCSPSDNTVHLWDPNSGERTLELDWPFSPWAVCFSPTADVLAVSGASNIVVLLNPETGERLRSLSGNQGTAVRLAFSSDGKWLGAAWWSRSRHGVGHGYW